MRGPRHLRAGARRRQAAVPRAHARTPATACSPASRAGRARARRRHADGRRVVQRLGHPHRRRGRGPLQPDVVPQRLGLAARQRASSPPAWRATASHRRRARVLGAMFDLSQVVDLHRLPELICGFHRRDGDAPTLYPVACAPQAWAAGAVYLARAGLPRAARRRRSATRLVRARRACRRARAGCASSTSRRRRPASTSC